MRPLHGKRKPDDAGKARGPMSNQGEQQRGKRKLVQAQGSLSGPRSDVSLTVLLLRGFVIHNRTQSALIVPIQGSSTWLDLDEKVQPLSRYVSLQVQELLPMRDTSSWNMLPIFQTSSGGSASPNTISVCTKLPHSSDLYLSKTTYWNGELVWLYIDIIYACFSFGIDLVFMQGGEVFVMGGVFPQRQSWWQWRTVERNVPRHL